MFISLFSDPSHLSLERSIELTLLDVLNDLHSWAEDNHMPALVPEEYRDVMANAALLEDIQPFQILRGARKASIPLEAKRIVEAIPGVSLSTAKKFLERMP